MNFLKLLYEFTMNESESSQTSDNSPDQSGQFQVIQLEQDCNSQCNKENTICTEKCDDISELNNNSSKCEQTNQHQSKPIEQVMSNQQKTCNQKLSKQYTLVQFDPQLQAPKQLANHGSASTIQLDQYYMIVSTDELTKKFASNQQWQQFYKKINDFNFQQIQSIMISNSLSCSSSHQQNKKPNKISLNLKQLNSILQIKSDEIQRRRQYWNKIAHTPITIKFKYKQLANKKDPKKLQQNVNKIMTTLVPSIMQSIQQNKYKPIQNVQDQIEKWRNCLIKVLTFYGANDKQIGYSKGLEYIALGVLVAKPFGHTIINQNNADLSKFLPLQSQCSTTDYCQLQDHFKYLLFTKQLRNMYFPGTPKLYQQIQLLTQLMRSQIPYIIQKLQQMKVDFIKLYINYYKTFLLYKIKNPQVIRKIMQLLVVYGIDIVKIVLTRIMNRNEKKVTDMIQGKQQIQLLRYLAQSLVQDYFNHSNTDQVIIKFKHLFVLDNIN